MSSTPPPSPKRIRWWPAVAIAALMTAAWVAIQFLPSSSRQERWTREAAVYLIGGILLVLWFFTVSGVHRRWKLRLLGVMLLAAGVFLTCFRYAGVTGDLMPRYVWRWGHDEAPPLSTQLSEGPPVPAPPGAADFPQFLGPNRNAKLPGPRLAWDWTQRPPQMLWRVPVGQGWSGFSIVGGLAVTQEQRGPKELVVCYELATGHIRWSHADETRHDDPLGGVGPRATPTIYKNRVYAQGATGILNCLDLDSGAVHWSKEIIRSNGAQEPQWGVSASPLIVGDWVIVSPGNDQGATIAAYHQNDGTRMWIGGNQQGSYSSPITSKIGGMEQILLLGGKAVAGYDSSNGKVLWKHDWRIQSRNPNVAVPVPIGKDRVHISSGYGKGSTLIEVRQANGRWATEEVWDAENRMKAKFTNLVESGGFIYGLDDGWLACQDTATGEMKWRDGKYGHGQILLVDTLLLVLAEDGQVALVEIGPVAWKEVARFAALSDKTWNPPALAGEYLVVRNDKEAACYRMPLAPPPPS